jgi:hypothetical protein
MTLWKPPIPVVAPRARCGVFAGSLKIFWLILFADGFLGLPLFALDATWEYSVQISATVQASPPQITLTWPQDTLGVPTSHTVYRKLLNDTSWGAGTILPGASTSYIDKNVLDGGAYEYQIVKAGYHHTGYGYIYAGIDAPLIESRGTLLLVVDNTYASNLINELALLQQDLNGDGWYVVRLDVGRNDSVTHVKSLIQAQYNADPQNVRAVFLFGHVPVPYSGDFAPDSHSQHQGAWPADAYYGDMDGTWTDSQVYDTGATDARNYNVPGDGKFDQSTLPAPVKLMVGRVDLANMPGNAVYNGQPTFPSESALLRNYLNKDHNFRFKSMNPPRRGIVGDYFGYYNAEAFAASGWRNFAAFFGAGNVGSLPTQGTWLPRLNSNGYLWAYACGPGQFTSINGIGNRGSYYSGNSVDIVTNNVQAVFTLIFGSWLGDWDARDNFMRSILATPTCGLACGWSGRPHWFCQHMALGQPIGYSTRLTQNNGQYGLYKNQVNQYAGYVHIALMGDPTLRMHVVAPPSNLNLSANSGGVNLSWTGSYDPVAGYNIYRSSNVSGPFTRVNSSTVTGTFFTDASATSGTLNYMVRAVKLETGGSGTYYNASQGIFSSIARGQTPPPPPPPPQLPTVTIKATGANASRLPLAPGTFTITRKGDTSTNLSVHYFLAGTATKGTDFQISPEIAPGIVVIPAGMNAATLSIVPQLAVNHTNTETAIVALTTAFPSPGYTIGWPQNDAVRIAGDVNVRGLSIQTTSSGPKLTWPSQPGKVYRIFYKARAGDNWTDVGVNINPGGLSTTWTDTTKGSNQQGFYAVFQSP